MSSIDYIGFDKLKPAIERQRNACGVRVKAGTKRVFNQVGDMSDVVSSLDDFFVERREGRKDETLYDIETIDDKNKVLVSYSFCQEITEKKEKRAYQDYTDLNIELGSLRAENATLKEKVTELEIEINELEGELEDQEDSISGNQSSSIQEKFLGAINEERAGIIVDKLMGWLGDLGKKESEPALSGVHDSDFDTKAQQLVSGLVKYDPRILEHLSLLLKTAKDSPATFNYLIEQIDKNLK